MQTLFTIIVTTINTQQINNVFLHNKLIIIVCIVFFIINALSPKHYLECYDYK